ncbi:phosphatase PAP2 family protein [Bizionia hallyeonensis]|uniref:Phosphatase PAP2 family protein n=1 Tax=Bizionia hallyeonensis TaxID=1123757 RepID=A0ABW0C8J2_9FLAO
MLKLIKFALKQLKQLLKHWHSKYQNQIPYFLILGLALFLIIGGINLFIELTENLKTDSIAQFDTAVTRFILSYRSESLTQYFTFITEVGDIYGYLIVFTLCTILFYLILKSWNYVVQLSLVMLLALSSNLILKQIINRSRPELEHLVTVKTLSYPSGHAMTAMAFYGFLIFLFYGFKIHRFLKFTIITLLIFLIFSIGISRIYLGVHFPSDILGGFVAGFIWVIFCAIVFSIITVFGKDPKT